MSAHFHRLTRGGRLLAGVLFALSFVSLDVFSNAEAAQGWWHEAELRINAHDHRFYRVTANSIGCEVRVRLHFDAPRDKYQYADADQNVYRFIAQVKMSGGDRFVSKVMSNGRPGPRVFSFSHDSQFDGCWAERTHKLRKVNIHSCRGVQCTPRGFD